jgi:hypothetical protein
MFKSTTSRRGIRGFGSRSTNWLLAALFLLFGAGAAHAESRWTIVCGDLGQRPCHSGDHIFDSVVYNASSGIGLSFGHQACDLALSVGPDGLCGNYQGNGGLRSIIGTTKNPTCGPGGNQPSCWLDFAMKQQRYGIQSDQAMNWITILGTHNSFSNYQDGGYNSLGINFNIDQQYSITDQLDAGARVIRLDPISYGITTPDLQNSDIDLRMCHQSSNTDSGTAAECHPTSYGRLFAYGVHEVEQWLERNPGEVVVMRMFRVANHDIDTIDGTLLNNLGDRMLFPPDAAVLLGAPAWFPSQQGWPTTRQMRSMNKNLIIFSDHGTATSFPWGGGNTPGNNVVDDGYTDATGFNSTLCWNQSRLDVRQRAFNQWGYIGEDRSGSNYSSLTAPKNLLDAGGVTTAANCGFGLIAVDFLLAGDKAAKVPFTYDYTFSDDDKRREAAIWSWDQNDFGDQGPAYLKTNLLQSDAGFGRWSSQAAGDSLPFACEMHHSPTNPANYDWVISTQTGHWSQGPYICGNMGAKFWAPQSALENQRLIAAVVQQRPGAAVWLNYNASPNMILEPFSINLVAGPKPNSFVINERFNGTGNTLTQGEVLQFTAGIGGVLNLVPVPAARMLYTAANFDLISRTVTISPNPNLGPLQPGSYTQDFMLIETAGSQVVTQQASITVNIVGTTFNTTVDSRPQGRIVYVDNLAYRTPHVFSWTAGTTHTLDASHPDGNPGVRQVFGGWAGGQPASFTYTVPDADATLMANFKVYDQLTLSPMTNGRIDLSPPSPDGFYLAGTQVTVTARGVTGYQLTTFTGELGGSGNPQIVTMSKPFSVGATFGPRTFNVTVQAQPPNAVIYVDNVAYTGTTKFAWPYGGTHMLDASKTDDGGGTHQSFTSWSLTGQPAKFSFVVPNGDTTVTGNFNMSYLLTLKAVNGTLTPSPSTADGYYAANTPVTITARPAARYSFAGFTGALSGATNPQTVTMTGPLTVNAAFNAAPQLNAAATVTGRSSSVVKLNLTLGNTGQGAAAGAQIVSATAAVAAGTGTVSLTTALPLSFGDIAAAAPSPSREMDFNWPASATRVVLTITYTANGGAYQGTQNVSVSRWPNETDN